MGSLLLTGLNIFGATLAMGLVASLMRPLAERSASPPTPRTLGSWR